MTNVLPPTIATRLKIKYEGILSGTTLGILAVQVVLLVTLTRRVMAVEQVLLRATRGGPPPTPVILDRIPDDRGQALGPADAPITVVEFSDFQCPYCANAVGQIKAVLAKYPNRVRFIYRHFPLTAIHSDSLQAAEAAECASEQGKFWEMHDLLFANQEALGSDDLQNYAEEIGLDVEQFDQCLTSDRMMSAVNQDLADGQEYGVNGTPTLFVNNQMIGSPSELEVAVKRALTTP